MRIFFSAIIIFLNICTNAQAPPIIQWQKTIGGSEIDRANEIKPTFDNGFIFAGHTTSADGGFNNFHDSSDVLLIKCNAAGNIEWQKCYGGSGNDVPNDLFQTADGGYITVCSSSSIDGDVSGNNGETDIWVFKIDISGNIEWQKNYGSSARDGFTYSKICLAAGGGYIISSLVRGGDGDVTGYHPPTVSNRGPEDVWIFKIDVSGNILWEKCFGGSDGDSPDALIATPDGGYVVAGSSFSSDGNITCSTGGSGSKPFWMLKLDNNGNVLWQQCPSFNSSPTDGKLTSDGGFIFTGTVSDSFGSSDIYVLKTNAQGIKIWEKQFGGKLYDIGECVIETNDGGYVVTGYSLSGIETICSPKGSNDGWIIKFSNTGEVEWQKNYGGSKGDFFKGIIQTPDNGYIVAGITGSDDGDVTGPIRGELDIWLLKLSFPGIEILPSVSITASGHIICPGQPVTFSSAITNGGTSPSYQWQINGISAADDTPVVTINNLKKGDSVNCILISNSPCVTSPADTSNIIAINVDPSLAPANFLPADQSICSYSTVNIKPSGNFKTYLWSTNDITPTLEISQTGIYWLQVTDSRDCQGRDTIFITLKDCPVGFFMPTAFTPNNDGKNDILKPTLGGIIKQYKLIIANRWGQIVFQTSDREKGWDGTLRGVKQNSDVYVWTCTYQFEGEEIKFEKGTVAIIR